MHGLDVQNVCNAWVYCYEFDLGGIFVLCITCILGGVIVGDAGLCFMSQSIFIVPDMSLSLFGKALQKMK